MSDRQKAFEKLAAIVDRLMGENGCPWDRAQTRETLKPYLIEETYEVLEALDEDDPEKIKDELGDLLYQILFHAKIGEQAGEFDIKGVIEALADKMVRRHPHIFGDKTLHTPDQVVSQWEEIKKGEQKGGKERRSALDGVPKRMPGLQRAIQLQKKAAKQGFDWDRIEAVFDKLDEEIAEFKSAVLGGGDGEMQEELGDILFALVNIARFKKLNPEEALRKTNSKFIRRFKHIENEVAKRGKKLKDTPLDEMERYWQEAKKKR